MKPGFPSIDPNIGPSTRKLLEGLKEVAEVGEGKRGDILQRNIKLRDLLDLGFVSILGSLRGGVVGSDLQPTIKPPSLSIPPAPTGFQVTGGFASIFLEWDDPQSLYDNHSYTIIYRHTSDNVANAVAIAQVAVGMLYADGDVNYGTNYYYWIQFVSTANVRGSYNSSVGTVGRISEDPAQLLARLQNKITESELYGALNSRINLIDAPGTGLVTKVTTLQTQTSSIATNVTQLTSQLNDQLVVVETSAAAIDGIKGQYTVKIDNNGVVSGYGLSSETVNGQVNSYFLVNADTFAIVNSGNSKTVSSLSRSGTTATANCTAHGYVAGDRITISNVHDSGWNGVWQVVSVPNANQFTFTVPSTIASAPTARIRVNGKALSALSRLGTTATAVFLSGHGLTDGAIIDISNANETGWNGKYQVLSVTGANTLIFTVSSGLSSTATASIKSAAQTIPFVVDSGKVVMDGAFIKNASISTAQVGLIAVEKITGVTSSFILSTIGTGNITNAYIGNIIQSNNYVASFSGWRIDKSGSAEFQNIYARGNIRATSLEAGTAMVDTLNVNGEAITARRFGQGSSGTISNGSGVTVLTMPSISLPASVSGVVIDMNATVSTATGNCNVFVEIYRNGILIGERHAGAINDMSLCVSAKFYDSSPGLSPIYSLRMRAGANPGGGGGGDYYCGTPTLIIDAAKR